MKSFTKSALCVAGVTMILGIGTCVAGLTYGASQGGFSWNNGSSELMTIVDDTNMEAFTTVEASFALGDIVVESGDSYGLQISISEKVNKVAQMEWSNENGVLRVAPKNNNHNWNLFNGIGMNLDGVAWLANIITGNENKIKKQGVVITIPRDVEMDTITLDASTGNVDAITIKAKDIALNSDLGSVRLENASASNSVVAHASSGSVTCENVNADTFKATSDLGRVEVSNITASNSFIESMSGSVSVDDCDFVDAKVDTDLGSIDMRNLEAQTLQLDNSSGSVNADNVNALKVTGDADMGTVTFEKSDVGDMTFDVISGAFYYDGKLASCNVVAGLGSVNVKVEGRREDYSIKAETDLGSIYIDGDKCGNSMNDGMSKPILEFSLDSGSLHVDFDN